MPIAGGRNAGIKKRMLIAPIRGIITAKLFAAAFRGKTNHKVVSDYDIIKATAAKEME